jgi:hypothetical protein
MPSAVGLTIDNQLSDGIMANPAYGITVTAGSPVVTAGAIAADPIDVGSLSKKGNNGGIYQSVGGQGPIRGATGYNLPGGRDVLMIYFDNGRVRVSVVPGPISFSVAEIDIAAGGATQVNGSFNVDGDTANYSVRLRI